MRFARLALLVVDEQHRFGVEQRDALVHRTERDGSAPHVLHMTATPIPRTLALTVYGDLDVTTIAGVPSGRQPVVTRLVDEDKREVGYDFVRKQIARGRQVYVVCPRNRRVRVDLRRHRRGRGRAPAGRALPRRARRGGARPAQVGRAGRRHAVVQDAARWTCWWRRA